MSSDQASPVRHVVAYVGGVRVIENLDEVFEWLKVGHFRSACEIVCRSTTHVLYAATRLNEPLVEWSLRTGSHGELVASFSQVGARDESRDAVWVSAGEWISADWHVAPSPSDS